MVRYLYLYLYNLATGQQHTKHWQHTELENMWRGQASEQENKMLKKSVTLPATDFSPKFPLTELFSKLEHLVTGGLQPLTTL